MYKNPKKNASAEIKTHEKSDELNDVWTHYSSQMCNSYRPIRDKVHELGTFRCRPPQKNGKMTACQSVLKIEKHNGVLLFIS